ncbi:MAG: deoxyribonuclease IV, partial [Eubacterium sp.]|nr:deoxyribonuclease IV [Eubacterium sp.]
VFEHFDKVIGIDQIAVFHINDSKNEFESHKDRHENFGFGNIGFDALMNIINMKEFADVPKILETPYVKDPENEKKSYPPYKYEIEMIKSGKFDPKLIEKIIKNKGE